MSQDQLRLIDYLEHMLEASSNIQEYLHDMEYAEFLEHKMARDAVIRNFEIIGEAAKNVLQRYPSIPDKYPQIPWRSLYGMRNALSHGYFKVDMSRIWQTVNRDLPLLTNLLQTILEKKNP